MTNLERSNRNLLLQFMLDNVGGTELNPIKHVKDMGDALQIEYEDGTKQLASVIVTDTDE